MREATLISLISGVLLGSIVIGLILSPSFRVDMLAGNGRAEIFGILSVQGAVVIVLSGILMGGILYPLSKLGPSKELVHAQEEIEDLKYKLSDKEREAMLLKAKLENPSMETIKRFLQEYSTARSLLRSLQIEDVSSPSSSPSERVSLIRYTSRYWVNGTVLRVAFLDGDQELHRLVRAAATQWTNETGLSFEFGVTPQDAEVRTTFLDGNWSYIGKEILNIDDTKKTTMSIERLPGSTDEEYKANALMLFGHVLGFEKEYMNPKADIPWDCDAVYRYFSQFNWSKDQIDAAFFHPKPLGYEKDFDPQSIMMPYFPKELFQGEFQLRRNLTLSNEDKKTIRELYPSV